MPSKAKEKDAKAKAHMAEVFPDIIRDQSRGNRRPPEKTEAVVASVSAFLANTLEE